MTYNQNVVLKEGVFTMTNRSDNAVAKWSIIGATVFALGGMGLTTTFGDKAETNSIEQDMPSINECISDPACGAWMNNNRTP